MTAPHQNLLGSGAVADTGETDAEFNQTILLLHGDGTNGGQNNTFVDSSTSNHTITRNGNTTQGTFNPFLGDGFYSTFFDGTANLQKTTSPFATNLSTFSIEAWIYMTSDPTGSSSHSGLVGMNVATDHNNHLSWGPTTNRKLQLFWYDGANKTCTGSTVLELNRWYFISVVVNSNSISMQVDGVAETLTGTTTLTNRNSLLNFIIGANGQTQFIGYTTNIRISDNARTITVPSTPLTEDSNTLFLYCGDNRFKDPADGTESISFGTIGGEVVPFSPLSPTSSYSESVHGGSGIFDGSSDYLSVADSNDFNLGSGDFTIEFWHYSTVHNAQNIFIGQWQASDYSYTILTSNDSDGKLRYIFSSDGSGGFHDQTSTAAYPTHAWRHVALVRQSNTIRLYQNGIQIHTSSYTSTLYNSAANLGIGSAGDGGFKTAGYMSNVNLIKGTCKYPDGTTFNIPTAPETAHANTKLLVDFTNASIIDNKMINNLETESNTQIDTSVKKFGTGSIEFDGSGYLIVSNSNAADSFFSPAASDFTWEMFVNFSVLSGGSLYTLFSKYGGASEYQFYYNAGNSWSLAHGSTTKTWADTSIVVDTWYHIALVKDGTDYELFKDGTSLGTIAFSNPTAGTRPFVLGSTFGGTNSSLYRLNGYLDEVRISRVARYISDFSPPVKAFANR